MSAHYSFRVDRTRGLVRIVMGGFFSHDDIAGFLEARRKAHRALVCAPGAHLTLNDLRAMKIQAPDIVEAFRELLGDDDYRSRRLALVVGPTLLQGQVRRALAGREGDGAVRCFTDPVAAETWLLAADREKAPPRRAAD